MKRNKKYLVLVMATTMFFCSHFIKNESGFNDAFSWRTSVLQREGKGSEDTVALLYEI